MHLSSSLRIIGTNYEFINILLRIYILKKGVSNGDSSRQDSKQKIPSQFTNNCLGCRYNCLWVIICILLPDRKIHVVNFSLQAGASLTIAINGRGSHLLINLSSTGGFMDIKVIVDG